MVRYDAAKGVIGVAEERLTQSLTGTASVIEAPVTLRTYRDIPVRQCSARGF
jgi:hypothetical protein